jgi:hypothetical protein
VKEPDVGSYRVAEGTAFVKPRHPAISFPKSKCLKFTVEYSNQKKGIPSSAVYKYVPCYDKISRPYMKMRY